MRTAISLRLAMRTLRMVFTRDPVVRKVRDDTRTRGAGEGQQRHQGQAGNRGSELQRPAIDGDPHAMGAGGHFERQPR